MEREIKFRIRVGTGGGQIETIYRTLEDLTQDMAWHYGKNHEVWMLISTRINEDEKLTVVGNIHNLTAVAK